MTPSPDNRAPTLALDEIERLLEKATPGPWRCISGKPVSIHSELHDGRHEICRADQQWGENRRADNITLIVALVADARARVAAGKAGGG